LAANELGKELLKTVEEQPETEKSGARKMEGTVAAAHSSILFTLQDFKNPF